MKFSKSINGFPQIFKEMTGIQLFCHYVLNFPFYMNVLDINALLCFFNLNCA